MPVSSPPKESTKRPDLSLTDSLLQRQMLPLALVRVDPAPVKGKHNCGLGWASDGASYFLKGQLPGHPLIPVNELVCYAVSAKVGILVPPCEIISDSLNGGEPLLRFGSRRIQPIVEDPATLVQLFKGAQRHVELDRAASKLHALDLFLNNLDRHPENLLIQQSSATDYGLIAIDFSCAFLANELPSTELANFRGSKTQKLSSALLRYGRFDVASAMSVVDRLDELPDNFVHRVLTHAPAGWIDDQTARQMQQWWSGPTAVRHARLQAIRRLLENATQL